MDLAGLDDFLRTTGSFNDEPDCGEPMTRVMSDFITNENLSDSGNGHSSPEYAFSSPEMAVPFAEDSPGNMQVESPMSEVPNAVDSCKAPGVAVVTAPQLDHTNPFASAAAIPGAGKTNPLYFSQDPDSNAVAAAALNQFAVQSPFSSTGAPHQGSVGRAVTQPPLPSTIAAGTAGPTITAASGRNLTIGTGTGGGAKPKIVRNKTDSKKRRRVKAEENPRPITRYSPDRMDDVGSGVTPMLASMVGTDGHPISMSGGSGDGAKKLTFTHHEPLKREMNQRLFDENYEELPMVEFEVQADKGFNFSPLDDAFVCQKKNHFQVSVSLNIKSPPKYVQIGNTLRPISGCFLAIWGLKDETPQSTVDIEQSHVDRSKKPFEPMQIQINEAGQCKTTFTRLHFSETTANNMRKKGKPNPDQRYFILLIEFHVLADGESDEATYATAHCQRSQRIIVRASNPGQFDGEVDMKWIKGKVSDSIVHYGPVGINTDRPMGALSVSGDVSVSGHIMHPSDRRVKEDLVRTDTKRQLDNVQNLQLYNYQLTEAWAKHSNRENSRSETGVIAQDLQQIIPEAVTNTKQVIELEDGEVVNELLIVDMDRVFMENVGAVQELCKMTENLDNRIKELEELHVAVKSGTFRRRRSSRRSSRKERFSEEIIPGQSPKDPWIGEGEEDDVQFFPVLKTASYILLAVIVFSLLATTIVLLNDRANYDNESPAQGGSGSTLDHSPAIDANDLSLNMVSTIASTISTSVAF